MEDFSDTLSVNDSKPTSYIALMLASSSKAEQLVDIGNGGGDGGGAASGNDSGASALSEQNSSLHNLDLTAQEFNPRKRKGVSAKRSEADENDRKEKCSKVKGGTKEDGSKAKAKDSNSSDTAESCPNHAADTNKTSAPPKQDYIHVRARRGQATDSHSLAERVRREKISERMKILQDLVPGCNKITGKAVMLDEIINYVQALQRQVEFLSMKLAAVNPQPDFHVEGSYLTKDILAPHCTSAMFCPDKMIVPPQFQFPPKFPFDEGMPSKSEGHDEATVRRMMDGQFPCISNHLDPVFQSLQIPHVWENEIQNGVDSRIFHHGKSSPLTSHGGFQGLLSGHLKVEL